MRRSFALGIYLALAPLLGGWARRRLNRRVALGKEDRTRLSERQGKPGLPRPEGKLVWFHAASVGESVSLLGLIGSYLNEHPEAHVLVTTGTVTSARMMSDRLPERAVHQYVPIDTPMAVRRFLDHWAPDLAIWTESELWPTMIVQTHARGCRMLLINARMSARSARRYRWVKGFIGGLLDRFERILIQDDAAAARFLRLGADPARVEVTGSLKDTAEPLPHDAGEMANLRKLLGGRTIWLAASTHPGEEEIAAEAHRAARRAVPGLMLIIAPRHPERGPEIARYLMSDGWQVARRSADERPDRNTEIYIADTLGELGLWYRLAAVSFVGGSLVPIGGHNPFEPALLGSAVLYGPHIENFESAYARFRSAGAAVQVPSADQLGPKLVETLPPDRAAALATAAWAVSSEGADVVRRVLDVIDASPGQPS